MEQTLSKIRSWFGTEAKNDNGFYRLYSVKHANSTPNRKDLRSTNFITDNLNDSVTKLDSDIKIHGSTAQQFFALFHVENKKDPHPVIIIFENPFFDSAIQKGNTSFNSINGINSNYNQQHNIGMLSMMKEHHENTSSLREEMQNLRHEHELEKMDSRIADLEFEQKTSVDRIGEFFQTDVGQQIVSGITQLMSQKMAQPKNNKEQQPERQPEQQPVRQNQKSDKNADVEKLNNSLVKLDKVFKGDGLQALNELADFCVQNPVLAKQFRKQQENE